jgi:hypothetical protein
MKRKSRPDSISGLNVQWPWSRKLLTGEKTVETRGYPLPEKHIGQPLAIIETPGKRGKREADIKEASVIGIVTFSGCFKYETAAQWKSDFRRHMVDETDVILKFRANKEKWGWIVKSIEPLSPPRPAPKKRGIVFANNCKV